MRYSFTVFIATQTQLLVRRWYTPHGRLQRSNLTVVRQFAGQLLRRLGETRVSVVEAGAL